MTDHDAEKTKGVISFLAKMEETNKDKSEIKGIVCREYFKGKADAYKTARGLLISSFNKDMGQ